ncbi:MAG: hypothetical protein ACR2QK_22750 [Acidimicrobiales bacterium]
MRKVEPLPFSDAPDDSAPALSDRVTRARVAFVGASILVTILLVREVRRRIE